MWVQECYIGVQLSNDDSSGAEYDVDVPSSEMYGLVNIILWRKQSFSKMYHEYFWQYGKVNIIHGRVIPLIVEYVVELIIILLKT